MAGISLPYAKHRLEAEVPDTNLLGVFAPGHLCRENGITQEELVRQALAAPIGSARLSELTKDKKNMVIITSDHTRPVPSRIIMPQILAEARLGNPAIEITILVATGFHRATTREELIDKLGENIVLNEKIVVHDSKDILSLVQLEDLPSGGELWLNRLAIETDLLIAEGFIEPHFFAGFSGGRKSVLPGVAGAQTVLANHCAEFINSTQARTGSVKDNPIHKDMLFAAKTANLAFIVNVVIDEDKQIVKAFAGDCELAHKTGCDFLREQVQVKVPQADIVITSNGGYPLDQNIYQAVKGMTAAEASIKDGGVIIMVAACNDGHGGQSFYDNMAQAKSPAELLKKIAQIPRHKTIPDQWEFQILARILDRCRVIMVTDMCPPEMIRAMHMEHASTINEALNKAFKIKGPDARVAVITDGVSVIVDKAEEQLREDRMNITVCIKQVPGTSEVEVDEKTGVLKRDGIDSKMNPFDLFAIESALRIKEKNNAKINIISMGPPQTKEIIKEAFMMGADSGTLLSDRRFAGADVLATAYTLAQGIQKSGHTDLIICGKQTTDGDTAQVGPEIAEFLDIPHVTNVREIIEIGVKDITLEMDLPHSVEVVKVKYPCLITVEKDINQPRLPSFKLKLATVSKDISVYGLDDFSDNNENNYGLSGSPTQVRKIFPPESNTTHEQWEGSGEELGAQLFERLNQMKFIEEGQ